MITKLDSNNFGFKSSMNRFAFHFMFTTMLLTELFRNLAIKHIIFKPLQISLEFWYFFSIVEVIYVFFALFLLEKEKIINKYTGVLCLLFLSSLINKELFTIAASLLNAYIISQTLNFQKFRLVYFFSVSIVLILIISYVALYGQEYYFDTRYGDVPTFGFKNPNTIAAYIVMIFMLFVVISNKDILNVIIAFFLLICLSSLLSSRAVPMLMLLYPIILFILKYIYCGKKLKYIPWLLLFTTLICAYLYPNSNIVQSLNKVLSGRFHFANIVIDHINSPVNLLFGNSVINVLGIPTDLSYVTTFAKFGLLATFLYLGLISQAMAKLAETKRYRLMSVFILSLFYCCIENNIINYLFIPLLFFSHFIIFTDDLSKPNVKN